jgi:hypothetical protein
MKSRAIRRLARGLIVLSSLILGACSTSHSVDDAIPNGKQPADVVASVDVPIEDRTELKVLANLVQESGGTLRVYRLPPEELPKEVLDNYSPEEAKEGPVHVEMDFRGTQVSDAQLAHISATPAFHEVTDFILSETPITDDALAHIAKAEKLRFLTISGTAVTDRGLEYLMGHKSLCYIFLDHFVDGRGISRQAEERLMRSLPKAPQQP